MVIFSISCLRQSTMSSSSSTTQGRNFSNQIYCHCNLQCTIFTSYQSRSRGRKFYRCSRSRTEGDCHYFRWCDEVNEFPNESNFQSSNVAENCSTHIASIRAELLQIKILLIIVILLIVIVAFTVNKCSYV
ncbi:hypothetical protein M5K25_021977 [Dendrobium thyrsiflorum]|uniref:GRF-type domain-containing protein n=1 Tax=Dendrobium thyrsiflorum TaxID=117978 RepID=A0ABD0U5F8_DENTH